MKLFLTAALAAATTIFAACGSTPATNAPANKPANTNTAANAASNANSAANTAANTASNTAAAPAAGAAQDFTLVNKTGVIIDKLFVSPADADDWEEDVLGQDTLADGATLDIKFKREEKAPKWDLKVEDSKGNSIEWHDLNLLEISKVTLHYKDGKGTAEVE